MTTQDLIAFFANYVTENKLQKIEKVLEQRTRYVTVAIEDIYKPHNASAILRTCDCLGVQEVQVIENKNSYNVNPYVTRGSSQWVDIRRFRNKNENNTFHCYHYLRQNGYKIYAASPNVNGFDVNDIPLDHKIAFIYGNEHDGLSEYALEHADHYIKLPMFGFTESYNISVCAAICLFNTIQRLHLSGMDYKISDAEKDVLRLQWYRSVVKRSEILEKAFLKRQQNLTNPS
jgi:tRNA (guanosine-2'-O-)-methyltransferase